MLPESVRIAAEKRPSPDPVLRKVIESACQALSCQCWTCGSCDVIDYARQEAILRVIIRMVNLGLAEELVRSPSIWLCLSCGRCTDACGQRVDGRQMFQRLQETAVFDAGVTPIAIFHMKEAEVLIYSHFLDRVDDIFGFKRAHPS